MSERTNAESIRLNRFLAQVGVGSRRTCDDVIAAGRVRINGAVTRSPGVRVVPGVHEIALDGRPVGSPRRRLVLLLHKPAGVVSTASDPQGRPTVIDLCGKFARDRRLFPVGRLDVNTTGALLVTNDGLLCYRLTHPRFEVPRTYVARVRGNVTARDLDRLRRMSESSPPGKRRRGGRRGGGGGSTAAAGAQGRVELTKELGKVSLLKITLYEGRNRQVRKMCEAVGLRVVKLKRVSFGPVSIRKLPLGAVRPLEKKELERLEQTISAGREDR
jgi:23S rRNA pseudouridine2605 synthase